jgi:IS6 family transposase
MVRVRPKLFRGRHFQDEIIIFCVRRYLRYSLSYRDLEETMAERNFGVDHSTVARWVPRYAPELSTRMRRHLRRPGCSWRVDETYGRVSGAWTRHHRLHALSQARPGCREAVSTIGG